MDGKYNVANDVCSDGIIGAAGKIAGTIKIVQERVAKESMGLVTVHDARKKGRVVWFRGCSKS